MKSLVARRNQSHLSQRNLARLAGISYKSLQLIESGKHDPKISTLSKIAQAVQYSKKSFQNYILEFFNSPPDSIAIISREMVAAKEEGWQEPFFNFVDAFRKSRDLAFVDRPSCQGLSENMQALLASAVEYLCEELHLSSPQWCLSVGSLRKPFFVSGVENLKCLALIESPTHFRKRNIFVMNDFLRRV